MSFLTGAKNSITLSDPIQKLYVLKVAKA